MFGFGVIKLLGNRVRYSYSLIVRYKGTIERSDSDGSDRNPVRILERADSVSACAINLRPGEAADALDVCSVAGSALCGRIAVRRIVAGFVRTHDRVG